MTIQVSTAGPGVEDWRSSKFAVTVNGGAAAYVYGFAREAQFSCIAWDIGDTVEQSWFGFGADETATVAITLADATPITSAVVYPKDAGVVQVIAAGVLTLTVPTNVRLRVEVNGDRAEVLSLFSSPLSTAPPFKTDAADLGQIVTNVSVDDLYYLTVPGHGWGSTGTIFRGFLQSTGTLPTTSAGTLTEHEAVIVYIVSDDTVQLIDSAANLIVFSSEGTGTITLSQAYWTTGTLFFGAGVHKIGRGFEVGSGSTIYLDRDAVVIGSFHLTEPNTGSAASSTLVEITGPGVIAGTYAEPSLVYALPSYEQKRNYAAIYVINETVPMDNVVSEVTVVAQPFYVNVKGVREFRHVKCISPWTYTTDGFSTHTDLSTDGLVGRCQSCYALVGDDAIKIRNRYRSQEFIDTFVTVTNNGCIQHFSIPNSASSGLTASMTNCHAMTLAGADLEGGGSGRVGSKMVWKALTDGYPNQSIEGHFNFNIDSLKIWGPIECRMFLLGNIANPFPGTYPVRSLYGQVSSMLLRNVWCEETPGQLSLISSKDATNTPHDIAFELMQIGGVDVTSSNYETFFEVSPFVYNLTWDVEVSATTFTVEDGTALSTANSYATIAAADSYWLHRGNPTAWSTASQAAREDALRQATFYLDMTYGHSWRGVRVTTTQSLAWPRYGAIDAVEGLLYSSALVPFKLRDACIEVAYRKLQGVDLFPDLAVGADSVSSSTISIGPMSISETFAGTASTRPRFPMVDAILRGLLSVSANSSMVRLTR
jgi:hypothetical protein